MSETAASRPLPETTERMRPFWEAARDGRLVLQHCARCDARHFPAVELCSNCLGSDALQWRGASGRGVVLSYVVMHQIYHPAFADEVPYCVVDVRLEEGARMISRLAAGSRVPVRVGLSVEVAFERASDDIYLPVFRPIAQ